MISQNVDVNVDLILVKMDIIFTNLLSNFIS